MLNKNYIATLRSLFVFIMTVKSVNKSEFVDAFAENLGVSKAQAARTVDSFFEVLSSQLASSQKVVFTGVMSFQVVTRKARDGHNPKTGQKIKIAEKKTVRVKPGKKLVEEAVSAKAKKKK